MDINGKASVKFTQGYIDGVYRGKKKTKKEANCRGRANTDRQVLFICITASETLFRLVIANYFREHAFRFLRRNSPSLSWKVYYAQIHVEKYFSKVFTSAAKVCTKTKKRKENVAETLCYYVRWMEHWDGALSRSISYYYNQ